MEVESLLKLEEIAQHIISTTGKIKAALLSEKEGRIDDVNASEVVQSARIAVLQASQDIQQLIQEPDDYLKQHEISVCKVLLFVTLFCFS